MESGHHKSTLLYCLFLLLPSRMSLLDLVAFRLVVINPFLCMPLNKGGMSGSRIVAHEKHGSLLPDPVSACECVLGGCAVCLCVCLLLCMGHSATLAQQGCVVNQCFKIA